MIYLMRHGLDDETKIGGWSDVDLIRAGQMQVAYTSLYLRDLKLVKIISSDILRCRTTAQIINSNLHLPIEYTDKLREQNKGLLNGIDRKEAEQKYPEYIKLKDIRKSYPEGESLYDLYHRVEALLPWILEQDQSLLITHRGVINMIYFLLQNQQLDENKEQFGVTHTSIHELDPVKRKIKKWSGK